MNTYIFEKTSKGAQPEIEAETEESARRKLMRRRINRYGITYSEAYRLKIVKVVADQNHVSIGADLIAKLKVETNSVLEELLRQTETWAQRNFSISMQRVAWGPVDWCLHLGIEAVMVNPGTSMQFLSFPRNFYNTRLSREYDRMKNEYAKIMKMGHEAYISKELKDAERHYDDCIQKLASRIKSKGLNEPEITMVTGRISTHIVTTITDGKKTIKAWPIVASGEIQRPHYRFLVK